jgi:hypothetical protein
MKMSAQKRALDKIYKRRNRYEIPDWQRDEVWSRPQKQKLIDSILRGWRLPKFYFLKSSDIPEEFEVLDGQQRLTAIFEFFDNELPLSKTSAEEFGGAIYDELPSEVSDAFDDFEIEYDEILDASEADQKEFFQRLQEGLKLTSSEKLNSAHSKLRDFCKKLSTHEFFTKKVAASNRRFGHFDIMAKVATLAIEGIDAGLRYDDIKQCFDGQKEFSAKSAVGKKLTDTLTLLDSIFIETDPLLRNRTMVQSFFTFVLRLSENTSMTAHTQRIRKFISSFVAELNKQVELGQRANDPGYIEFQKTVSANVRGAAKTRQTILLRKLFILDPGFVDCLDPAAIAESGVTADIANSGRSISETIGRINEAYAAKHGEDLFKATNKTAQAFTVFTKPATDLPSYTRLVDHLYFVFHEGVGDRLEGKKPQSFVDVNSLRTDLQHDVDHGKPGKVRAKRRKLSQAFQKYSGMITPSTLAPEKYPLVHAALLSVLAADLRSIELAIAGGTF